jgi:hypothetical protein
MRPWLSVCLYCRRCADLARLESELAILLEHVESVASQTRKGAELIRENAQNIWTAISRARELGGGVVISS